MSWAPATDVVTSISLSPGDGVPVQLRTSRSEQVAWLMVGSSPSECEIRLDRAHVEALRDQLPDVFAAMDRVVRDTAACVAAGSAGERAVTAAVTALDQANAAQAAGADDLAAAARAAAAQATAAADEVDARVQALEEAVTEADDAADRAIRAAGEAAAATRDTTGAELAGTGSPATPEGA